MDQTPHRPSSPVAAGAAQVVGDTWRITVLTDGLVRLEHADDGDFEDRPSTLAQHRDLPVPPFEVHRDGERVEVVTSRFRLSYDGQPFSPGGLTLQVRGDVSNYHSLWRFGDPVDDLGGTARTLDGVDGALPLGPGVVSRWGYAVLDDSGSMVFTDDGWVDGRDPARQDLYVFAYGLDHREALQAFYAVSGPQPLLPRYALGCWWSRYHAYTAEEYRALIERFEAEGLPFSVAVVDMDWHLVDIDPSLGSGWTGYTWNRDLIPDPDAFCAWLHEHGLRVTLNVHPADGVRAHEDAYAAMCEALGRDPSAREPIAFDVTDRAFVTAYLEVLHRGLEDQGVDFWWLDWQQGTTSRTPGVDPLWVLNHVHYLDSARRGRPLTFSRYAGPGSHRYPVGFSGDTVISWDSLAFQPHFTASASNIGYGWWSHDVGGHFHGTRDDELATRWLQLGVFSPITRLHSGNSPFSSKEPWRFGVREERVMGDLLLLRHRLLPYLHTMNHRAAHEGRPLVEPMYYEHPERSEAYDVPHEFLFGSELLVVPVTSPADPATRTGSVRAWLPPGPWVDVLEGRLYDGDREVVLHRPLETLPVLATAGAIVPLDADVRPGTGVALPGHLEVLVVVGADGRLDLVEDDDADAVVRTPITLDQSTGEVVVGPAEGDRSLLPPARGWTVRLLRLDPAAESRVTLDGDASTGEVRRDRLGTSVLVPDVPVGARLVVHLGDAPRLVPEDPRERLFELLDRAHVAFDLKESVLGACTADVPLGSRVATVVAMDLGRPLETAVLEILCAAAPA